jgi:hypothetical protein
VLVKSPLAVAHVRAWLPSLLSLLLFPLAVSIFPAANEVAKVNIEVLNGRVYATFSNVPPCLVLQASRDLTNWFDQLRLSRADAQNWESLTFWLSAPETNQFWRVLPAMCCR